MYRIKYNNGALIPSVRMLQRESLEDGNDYNVEIIKDKRTVRQNNYLHLIFQKIADWYNNGNENETGEYYSKDSAKARILYEVLPIIFIIITLPNINTINIPVCQ